MSVPCAGRVFTGATRISTTIGSTAASHGTGATTMAGSSTADATLVHRSRLTGYTVTISDIVETRRSVEGRDTRLPAERYQDSSKRFIRGTVRPFSLHNLKLSSVIANLGPF